MWFGQTLDIINSIGQLLTLHNAPVKGHDRAHKHNNLVNNKPTLVNNVTNKKN